MTGLVQGARVEIVHGPLRGVQGVVEALQGATVRLQIKDLPPRLERSELGATAIVRAVDVKVLT